MLFDMEETTEAMGMFPFPDFPFANLEKPASEILSTSYIRGSDNSDSAVGGSTDD